MTYSTTRAECIEQMTLQVTLPDLHTRNGGVTYNKISQNISGFFTCRVIVVENSCRDSTGKSEVIIPQQIMQMTPMAMGLCSNAVLCIPGCNEKLTCLDVASHKKVISKVKSHL